MDLPSKILEEAVERLTMLPGVGRRSALRYALHIIREDEQQTQDLTKSLLALKRDLHHCRVCHNISDEEVCPICASGKRNKGVVCVVENIQDVMAVENTNQYNGVYHVLGGVISPIDGVGVQDLEIGSLIERVKAGGEEKIEEVILALPTTMEGETTNFYIYRQLVQYGVKITTLARGVAVGDSLEYADEVTLGRSIVGRIPFGG